MKNRRAKVGRKVAKLMGFIGGRVARLILDRYEWRDGSPPAGYQAAQKLEILFGPSIWDAIRHKRVLDFGCGEGHEALEIAQRGAAEVIGVDIRDDFLEIARRCQAAIGVQNCRFLNRCEANVDVILSVDSFEHFQAPDLVLREMSRLLNPGGRVIFSFGPPWYHPLGGHFPLFPWAHLVLTERSLMQWRSQYKTDGATRFHEVAGGLNQMSIRRFERVVKSSPFRLEKLEAVPIRALRPLHSRLTREFFTSVVRGALVLR